MKVVIIHSQIVLEMKVANKMDGSRGVALAGTLPAHSALGFKHSGYPTDISNQKIDILFETCIFSLLRRDDPFYRETTKGTAFPGEQGHQDCSEE